MTRPMALRLSTLAVGLSLAACTTPDPSGSGALQPQPTVQGPTCPEGASAMAQVDLLFGTGRRDQPPVSANEWADFLDTQVTPRFPDGLTVLRGDGQWRGGDGRIGKEDSIVLLIWYEPSAQAEAGIEAIRTAYKARFDQESVMRVDGASCVSF